MIWTRKLILVAVFIMAFVPVMFSSIANVYITPDGSSQGNCTANPHAPSWFNNSADWGNGAGQIGPGTVVLFCGTFTDVVNGTLFTVQGGGASGNPVTLKFDTGTIWQSPAESAFLNGNNQSHFLVDGGTTCGWVGLARVTCNGLIQNTLNGYSGQNCPGGSCQYQVGTIAIQGFLSDLEVRNLTCGPIYIHGGTGDTTFSAPGPKCIDFTSGGGTMDFHNLIIHDCGWCLNGGGNNITVANSEIYFVDHCMGMGQYSDTPSTWSGVTWHDMYCHDNYVWDQSNNSFHHDGIHLFSYCSTLLNGNNTYCPETIITGINIYNYICCQNFGANNTSPIFFEGNIRNATIFNYIAFTTSSGNQLNNGNFNGYGTNINFFNNTAIGNGVPQSPQTQKFNIFTGPGIVVENNVYTDGGMISTNGPFPSNCPYTAPGGQGTVNCVNLSYTLMTNAYLSPSDFSNGFGYDNCTGSQCSGNGFLNFNSSGFTSFERSAPETGGIFKDTTEPNGNWINNTFTALTSVGQELTGSPTINAGTNLASLCLENGGSLPNALCSDIAGNPRPGVGGGNWDIGAYVSSPAPAAPTGLTAIVQ